MSARLAVVTFLGDLLRMSRLLAPPITLSRWPTIVDPDLREPARSKRAPRSVAQQKREAVKLRNRRRNKAAHRA